MWGGGDRYDDNCFWFFSFRSISPYFEHVSLMFYLTIHCDVQSIYTGVSETTDLGRARRNPYKIRVFSHVTQYG